MNIIPGLERLPPAGSRGPEFAMDIGDWTRGQQRLAEIVARWRGDKASLPVFAALERFAQGASCEDCAPLVDLFGPEDAFAKDFVGRLVTGVTAVLGELPLGQVPLRHARRRSSHTLLLARAGGASLAVTVYDGAALAEQAAPNSAEFTPMETWLRVLAGTGMAERITRPEAAPAPLQRAGLTLRPGMVHRRVGNREALQLRAADGALVVLRLQRCLPKAESVQEFRIDDGILLHTAAVRAEDSRLELAIAVLVAQGRREAVPALSRIVTGSAAASLRWSALRAVLGLDTRAGLVLLGELTADEDAVLAAAARGLQRDLTSEWPELERVAQWRG